MKCKASFHNVSRKSVSILLHGVITLPDATSYDKCSYYSFQKVNNKVADQTARICRLLCNFVVHIQQSGFLALRSNRSLVETINDNFSTFLLLECLV